MGSDMSGLLALAERVEKLDGPDREMDAAIAKALNLSVRTLFGQSMQTLGHPVYLCEWVLPTGARVKTPEGEAPAFTDSLDAAI